MPAASLSVPDDRPDHRDRRRQFGRSASRTSRVNEPIFQGHFPGNPIFPGVLIIEGMAQTAGAIAIAADKTDGPARRLHGHRRQVQVPQAGAAGRPASSTTSSKIRRRSTMGWYEARAMVGDDADRRSRSRRHGHGRRRLMSQQHPSDRHRRARRDAGRRRQGRPLLHRRRGQPSSATASSCSRTPWSPAAPRSARARTIFPFASIGHQPQDLKYAGEPSTLEIGADTTIREHVTINPGTAGGGMITSIGDHCLLMIGVHIGHDCIIGNNVILSNNVGLRRPLPGRRLRHPERLCGRRRSSSTSARTPSSAA